MTKKKIAVITGSRAEYGLLYWLMKDIQEDPDLELQVIVTGMHLSPEFGLTYQLIEQDGFKIQAKVESQLSSDTGIGVSKSVGLGIIGFADAYENLRPDFIILLGDRFEILAAATAALFAKIPIAHLCGGEVTEGAFDESIRHAISKMALLHFVSTEPYRYRVIQLGEHPDRVFNVGFSGLDHLTKTTFLTRAELENQLNFKLGKRNFLVTYHPPTLAASSPDTGMQALFDALDLFQDDYIIFTKSNADTGGRKINKLIDHYIFNNSHRSVAFTSLGTKHYLSLLNTVDLVIGNSSSGILEVPFFKIPTINIGLRQAGRLRASSVIDCEAATMSIVHAIEKGLTLAEHLRKEGVQSPYHHGNGNISKKIKEQIKEYCSEDISLMKSFYDM